MAAIVMPGAEINVEARPVSVVPVIMMAAVVAIPIVDRRNTCVLFCDAEVARYSAYGFSGCRSEAQHQSARYGNQPALEFH
jgi:hypothetical protein